jgi:alkaline phosphatase
MKERTRAAVFSAALAIATASAAGNLAAQAKYVFFFIGDGMALSQVSAAEIYAKAKAEAGEPGFKRLGFTQFPAQGITTTYDSSSIITDSASAVTALATGNKTLSGVINMDPGKKVKHVTIAELAKKAGYGVGVVSNVSLDHATPAGFYAKVPSRGDMYDIAMQLADSGFDYFGGGGFAQPRGPQGDKPDAIENMKSKGYKVVDTVAGFKALKAGDAKVVAVNQTLQDSMAMPYDIDRKPGDLSLADYVAKGIELLSPKGSKGFFFAIESGKIDWACHANDAAAAIGDVLAFDEAIGVAVDFMKKYPKDTLIVVTGDHETGGMSIGFAGTQYSTAFGSVKQMGSYVAFNADVLAPYKASHKPADASLEDLYPVMLEYFNLDFADLSAPDMEILYRSFMRSMKSDVVKAPVENEFLLYGGYEPFTVTLTHLANQRAGIGWTTYAHTGVPVPTFAVGRGAASFDGYYDNTDIFRKLVSALGIKK